MIPSQLFFLLLQLHLNEFVSLLDFYFVQWSNRQEVLFALSTSTVLLIEEIKMSSLDRVKVLVLGDSGKVVYYKMGVELICSDLSFG